MGNSRGVGGTAVKVDTSYYLCRNFISWKTITTGPLRTSFQLTYADWDANGKKITETKTISLDYGSYLSKFEIEIIGTKQLETGLTLHEKKGTIATNVKQGWLSYWEPLHDSEIGSGIVVPNQQLLSYNNYLTNNKDLSNLYGTLAVQKNKVVYYAGFGWKKGSPFENQKQWNDYLADFAIKSNNPLQVSVQK